MERADSRRGIPNNATCCGCYWRGYRSRAGDRSLRGCPGADTYDDRSSLSNSHRYSRAAHAYAYADADPYPHADTDAHAHPNADPDPDPHAHSYAHADFHAYPYARLQRRTIPKLGVEILR